MMRLHYGAASEPGKTGTVWSLYRIVALPAGLMLSAEFMRQLGSIGFGNVPSFEGVRSKMEIQRCYTDWKQSIICQSRVDSRDESYLSACVLFPAHSDQLSTL